MKIILASDNVGLNLKLQIAEMLTDQGHQIEDIGVYNEEASDYPIYGRKAAEKLARGEAERAILFCGTGFGISLAANKVPGVRCVNCTDVYTAKLSRQHNNSNAMALGARVLGTELAKMLVEVWLNTEFDGGRHARRITLLENID